ncbi:hypothetical protein [Shimia abyssi]|uniref:Uncharacterized protein n=1 Tax=Shimia abyssi TaxID=1662395 RepID=A0A2P8FJB7_9RHOB|nr:hypothetical protein [Shimia abyssi]PSL21826.1 hypothetical protein CLV88_101250 [Shimia abyssi]
MVDIIHANQLLLMIAFFGAGSLGALLLYRQPKGSRAWEIADLLWVVLGGVGAIAAIIAGIYQEDSTRLDRQITVAYTASHAFDTDAARFRLRNCAPPQGRDLTQICEKVEFLSASTAKNSALPLFLSVSEHAAPLQGLGLGFLRGKSKAMDDMEHSMRQLNESRFLVFDPRDVDTVMALGRLGLLEPAIAADYRVLALSYDALINQVTQLRADWQLLQANRHLLAVQIIALCLLAFAAPFRLGKSVVALF